MSRRTLERADDFRDRVRREILKWWADEIDDEPLPIDAAAEHLALDTIVDMAVLRCRALGPDPESGQLPVIDNLRTVLQEELQEELWAQIHAGTYVVSGRRGRSRTTFTVDEARDLVRSTSNPRAWLLGGEEYFDLVVHRAPAIAGEPASDAATQIAKHWPELAAAVNQRYGGGVPGKAEIIESELRGEGIPMPPREEARKLISTLRGRDHLGVRRKSR